MLCIGTHSRGPKANHSDTDAAGDLAALGKKPTKADVLARALAAAGGHRDGGSGVDGDGPSQLFVALRRNADAGAAQQGYTAGAYRAFVWHIPLLRFWA